MSSYGANLAVSQVHHDPTKVEVNSEGFSDNSCSFRQVL